MRKLKADVLNLTKDDTVLLALSGGADSMVLLDLVQKQSEKIGFKFTVAHVNHQLRKESEDEETFLRNYCQEKGIDFYSTKLDLDKEAGNLEEIARDERYQFLRKTAKELGIKTIITAHHLNDQAETVFMRIGRGSGLRGLTGIPRYTKMGNIHLYRPLLDFSKQQILEYSQENNIPYFNDSSNSDNSFKRNAIRNEIFPLIEQEYPAIQEKLVQISNFVQTETYFINKIVNHLVSKWVRIVDGTLWFDSRIFSSIKEVLKEEKLDYLDEKSISYLLKELTRGALGRVGLLKDFSQPVINNIINFFLTNSSGHLDLPNDLIAVIASGQYLIGPKKLLNSKFGLYSLGNIKLKDKKYYFPKENVILSVKIGKNADFSPPKGNENRILMAKDKVPDNLMIRSRINGDRIFLPGLNRRKKLARFFVDKKVPIFQRDRIPIIASDNEIVWIPKFYLDPKLKVSGPLEDTLELTIKDLN